MLLILKATNRYVASSSCILQTSGFLKRKSIQNVVCFFSYSHSTQRHELARSRSLPQEVGIHPDGGGMGCQQVPPETA